jgi:hypothetical protein
MFVSRDQENLAHVHHTAAAAKPLNQSVRALQPKTPSNRAPKTPLRVALNDENKPLGLNGQKTGLKSVANGNENIIQTTRKDGKLDKKTFVTPIGEFNRDIYRYDMLIKSLRPSHACSARGQDY